MCMRTHLYLPLPCPALVSRPLPNLTGPCPSPKLTHYRDTAYISYIPVWGKDSTYLLTGGGGGLSTYNTDGFLKTTVTQPYKLMVDMSMSHVRRVPLTRLRFAINNLCKGVHTNPPTPPGSATALLYSSIVQPLQTPASSSWRKYYRGFAIMARIPYRGSHCMLV